METTGGACSYIWTPLTKMENGDSFINMNDNTETTVLNWARGQPNGGENENFVLIKVAEKALADAEADWPSCSSCRISKMLLLHLDGRCEHSLMGNVREYQILYLLYTFSITDQKYKIFNTRTSIGFNGWKSITIRLSLIQ